jgi:hypothetical protein
LYTGKIGGAMTENGKPKPDSLMLWLIIVTILSLILIIGPIKSFIDVSSYPFPFEQPREVELMDSIFVFYRRFLGINLALWIGSIVASWVFYMNDMRKKTKIWSSIALGISLIPKIITFTNVLMIIFAIFVGLAWN